MDDLIFTRKKKKRKKLSDNNNNDGTINTCSICLELLNSSGYHQICCLKCGHIFGRKCIELAIKKSGLCPICKNESSTRDIRNLYNTRISCRDIGDRDNWVNKYHHLMNKLNKEMCKSQRSEDKLKKQQYQNKLLQQTINSLKTELIRMKTKYQNEQNQKIELMTQYQCEREQQLLLNTFTTTTTDNIHHHNHETLPWE